MVVQFTSANERFYRSNILPGITYEYVSGKSFPKKLLKGKTSRIIVTADTPNWYHNFFMNNPLINQFKKGTLEFCGIKPVKVTYIAPIKNSNVKFREDWLTKIEKIGKGNK